MGKTKYEIRTCPKCKGEKWILSDWFKWTICPKCKGTGAIKYPVESEDE